MSNQEKNTLAEVVNPTVGTKPNEVPVVPTDWISLGVKTGYNPKLAEKLNIYILGPYNEGKTTFDASIPNNFILDFEDGANAVVGTNSVRVHIRNFPHFEEVIKKLLADAKSNKRHWTRISFDSIEEYVDLIKHQLEEEKNVEDITDHGSRGHGYNLILQRCWSYIIDLEQAGYVWAIVGHQKLKSEVNPATKKEETKIREAVYPIVANKIKNAADFQLTIYCLVKTIRIQKKRKLATGQIIEQTEEQDKRIYFASSYTTDRGEGKARGVPTMNDKFEIPLINGWDVFKKLYDKAVEAAKKEYGQ